MNALTLVDCDDRHDYQLVLADGVFESADGADYPSDDEWAAWEQANCVPALENFTGQPYGNTDIDYVSYTPIEEDWEEGDRSVWCAAYRGETKWTGSLEAG